MKKKLGICGLFGWRRKRGEMSWKYEVKRNDWGLGMRGKRKD